MSGHQIRGGISANTLKANDDVNALQDDEPSVHSRSVVENVLKVVNYAFHRVSCGYVPIIAVRETPGGLSEGTNEINAARTYRNNGG